VIEQLARLGVGTLVAVDPDVFEEHNLNRQLLSSPSDLGRSKVTLAAQRVAGINPAVTVIPHGVAFTPANGAELFAGVQLVVDALDSIPVRLELAAVCAGLDLPLVHGAIGGWYGHVTTQFPGEETIQKVYANWVAGKGVEQQLGNPSFTPAVVASLQVAEVCKLLLGELPLLRGRMLSVDLLSMEFHEMML
jgi:molybdopterin/thiamine biosynthesis adenylyltransferase